MNLTKLETRLDADLSWRIKEISDLFLAAKNENKEALLKSMILLLYAHWEGFIKSSSLLYLKFISDQKIPLEDLETNFRALSYKNEIKRLVEKVDSLSIHEEKEFIAKTQDSNKKFKLNVDLRPGEYNGVINTEQNLKETVLKRIFVILGLEYKASLQTKKNYIDKRLLGHRNSIAHGDPFQEDEEDEFSLSLEDIEDLKNVVLLIMSSFKEELVDYATNSFFLKEKTEQKSEYEEQREAFLHSEFQKMST